MKTEEDHKHIMVTHVNVRVSLVFLLIKLVLLDVVAGVLVLLFFGVLSFALIPEDVRLLIFSNNVGFFILLVAAKIILTIFLVVQWINEYYEITPTKIIYRRGIIWRREDAYNVNQIRSIGVRQSIFGRVFNYGTLFIYDRGVYKYYYFNDLHNPLRYLDILHNILPDADIEKEVIREHIRDTEAE
jgi:hypothetical protein